MKLSEISGIEKRTLSLLKKLKIESIQDLLLNYPRRYEQYPLITPIRELSIGRYAIACTVKQSVRRGNNGLCSLLVSDGTGSLVLRWFHNPYVNKMIKYGQRYVFYGDVDAFQGKLYMKQASFMNEQEYICVMGSFLPIYPLTEGLSNQTVFHAVLEVLDTMPEPEETLPQSIRSRYELISKGDSIRCIHYPANQYALDVARKRIVFEEFYQLLYALREKAASRGKNYFRIHGSDSVEKIICALPYQLTKSQITAVEDIKADFQKDVVANRLIQGDVGSGKTMVAILAMAIMADNLFQSALMAPTEVLANQHYEEISALLCKIGKFDEFHPVLLTGSMKEKDKKTARELIYSGHSKIIVGTHALIQEQVVYKDLALVIIDEQHRFGVDQRDGLSSKGSRPVHTIVMTATPIPRTTGSILFGGMDISIMKDRPSNRLPIINHVANASNMVPVYQLMKEQLQQGHQCYVICPLVTGSGSEEKRSIEACRKNIEKYLPQASTGILYGKMDAKKKQEAMDKFAAGQTQILISTTVVEVGVNVPNATVIVIENSNMFGMLQLHQLRGRVGRGADQSYCVFVNSDNEPSRKLDTLAATNDGFEIAEADYYMRKGGQLLGTKQSGDMGFKLADIVRDEALLNMADEALRYELTIF